MDEATVDAYLALANRLGPMQKTVAEIERRKAEIRAQHPAYKYLRSAH